MRRVVDALCALWLACSLPSAARADDTLTHVVRPGETLASIAQLYYGDPRREGVIVAENGLGNEGGSSIVVGLHLVIPTVRYHVVAAGETWNALAEQYYGDARRAFALIEANSASSGKQPDVGAEILVPYPLRFSSAAHDPVRQAAKEHFDGSTKAILDIRRFNSLKTARGGRGEILLLPLSNLVLSAKGKALRSQSQPTAATDGEVRDKQLRIHDELPLLHEHVVRGRYVEAVAMANQLVGLGDLTGNQIVSIQRELGTALIALDRDDLAKQAFMLMLEKQPDVELGLGTTSPKVLRVLEEAKTALSTQRAAGTTQPTAAQPTEADRTATDKPTDKPTEPPPSAATTKPTAAPTAAASPAPSDGKPASKPGKSKRR